MGVGRKLFGTIYQIKDSSLLLANTSRRTDLSKSEFDLTTINHYDISLITVREKKDVSKGLRIGMLIGAATGVIIGIISATQAIKESELNLFPAELGILLSGLSVGAIGAWVGAGTGALLSSFFVGDKNPC